MEFLLNWLRGCRLGEAFWAVIVAAEMFCVGHKFLVGALSLSLLLSVFLWLCLRRVKASKELTEGGKRRYCRVLVHVSFIISYDLQRGLN